MGGDYSSKTLETGSYVNTVVNKSINFYVGGSINDQVMLTTFKKIEETIIEEHGVGVENKESTKVNDKEEKKSITEEDGVNVVAEST